MIETIRSLPDLPGIYQYFDASGRLLYVGKAKSLTKRVKSYFRFSPALHPNPNLSQRILKMLSEAVSLEIMVATSEHDALILENTLIKQLKPKYNILLRDDKTYPYIYVNLNEDFPRFEITRKVIAGKNIRYFGPYPSGGRDIVNALYELCQLVQKKGCLKGKKACLYYQLEKCLAPCEGRITPEAYREIIDEAIVYIENKSKLIKALESKMHAVAEQMRFEEAAALRDQIDRISKSEQLSTMDLATKEHYDIFAIAHNETLAIAVRLFMRHGKIISSSYDRIVLKESLDLEEAYEQLLLNFYAHEIPPITAPILLAHPIESAPVIGEYLSERFGKKMSITSPQRGTKKKLVELALANANELLRQSRRELDNPLPAMLQELCALEQLPTRIEVFDNSHMGGQAPVGGMITFDKGAFDKSGYRHYHLQSTNEYDQMRETLLRRIEGFEQNPPPDLWVIDGGRTLLQLAQDLLASHAVYIDVIAISKEKVDAKTRRAKGATRDLLHSATETFTLPSSDKRLQFIQRLRDEAHRFAITFHQKTKRKHDQTSKLLEVKGISPAKIKKLLNHFGTFEAIRSANEAEIASLLNQRDATLLTEHFHAE